MLYACRRTGSMAGGRSTVLRYGAVAQLGERQNRTLEVGGSTPLCSTNDFKGLDMGRVSDLFVFLALFHYFFTIGL